MRWNASFDGPLYTNSKYRDTKDPCPVFDGKLWHIFGSGGSVLNEDWSILHATAEDISGPWIEQESLVLPQVTGGAVAAPGVIFDNNIFHMFVQTDCFHLNGTIEYLTSTDGFEFTYQNTALYPLLETRQLAEDMITSSEAQHLTRHPEIGIYDSHPAIIDGEKYFVYSGMAEVGRPDIYLAKSTTNLWQGPWERVYSPHTYGPILVHEAVIHHNQHTFAEYEWGLEGAQLIQLPQGLILLNGVCFLPQAQRGRRQRIFLAVAENVLGPYTTVGPLIDPPAYGWDSGENGHAAGLIHELDLLIVYQARPLDGPWRYGLLTINLELLEQYLKKFLTLHKKLHGFTPLLS
jgi:hypothetical protein